MEGGSEGGREGEAGEAKTGEMAGRVNKDTVLCVHVR